MVKKIVLGVAVAVVLIVVMIAAKNLVAPERKGVSETEQKGSVKMEESKRAGREAVRKRIEDMRQRRRDFYPGQDQLIREGFDKWLNELTKAYKENDREKMEQLLKKMQEYRQELQKRIEAREERMRDLRKKKTRERKNQPGKTAKEQLGEEK